RMQVGNVRGIIGIMDDRCSHDTGRDLSQQLQPFAAHRLVIGKAGEIATRPRQAGEQTAADWIGHLHEYDWDCAGRFAHGIEYRLAVDEYDVRRASHQVCYIALDPIDVVGGPTVVDPDVTAFRPADLLQLLPERGNAGLPLRIVLGERDPHADPSHPLWLLRTRRERPCRSAAEQRDELATPHSITSSRRPSSGNGTSTPSALAVLRLITRWTAVACITGRSAGLTPLRIRLA